MDVAIVAANCRGLLAMAADNAFEEGVGAIAAVFDFSPLWTIVNGFRSITCRAIGEELICLGSDGCSMLLPKVTNRQQ